MIMERIPEERMQRWLGIAKGRPPEWLAGYVESPLAAWSAIVEEGPENDRKRHVARLEDRLDLPYWAFVLAKSYLDDVGEWPLYGLQAENALSRYEGRNEPDGDPGFDVEQAAPAILEAARAVWPDVTLVYLGRREEEPAAESDQAA